MRSAIVCLVLACGLYSGCNTKAAAGPVLDRLRERREQRQAQRCQPAPVAPAATAPAQSCPGGVCPIPARVPAYLPPAASPAPKAVRWEYRCVNGRCQLVQVVE